MNHALGENVEKAARLLEELAELLRESKQMVDGEVCPHCGGPGPGCQCENDE